MNFSNTRKAVKSIIPSATVELVPAQEAPEYYHIFVVQITPLQLKRIEAKADSECEDICASISNPPCLEILMRRRDL